MRFDPRDANAPYTLQPVSGQPGIYCRYDAGLKPAGVVAVLDPVEQKRQNDARKRRMAERYEKRLGGLSGIRLQVERPWALWKQRVRST